MAIKLDSQPNSQASPQTIAEHWNFCGQCYYELGQYDDALRHYESAIKKNNSDGNYFYNRALVKAKLDKLEDAIQDYSQAINNLTEAKYIYQARFNKGVCLRKLGRLDDSIEDLKQAVQLQGDSASAHNNLGLSYFEKEDYEEALSEFTKAIAIEQHPFHFNNRGLANYHLNRIDEAKNDYDDAIKRNPDDSLAFFNRGNVYLNKNDFEQAHADYDTAISKEPKNPKYWHSKGIAYEAKASQVDPKNPEHASL